MTTTPDTTEPLAKRAQLLLAELAGPEAVLREDQRRAIEALVTERRRVLVVQRTGWGKSAVYFLTTRLRRDAGAGPTLLVSPLLALMRDQIAAAERIGLRAVTINSTNVDDWQQITQRIARNEVDLLLISPERLNHPQFRAEVLDDLGARVGLVVVDEAHCVSDWGHDFRPDYRRIVTLLERLPSDVPVLATTATANDRVTADVAMQLGAQPLTLRGSLDRESLHLSVLHLDRADQRLAWLAAWVSEQGGAGIVYCLTVAETERVAEWLRSQGIRAAAYSGKTDPGQREVTEAALKANELDCVVATSALGMGYDKPDLHFVVHYGMPSSPIAYYQAIGRAGRAVDRAEVVLVPTGADEAVWAYFESTAFPPPEQVHDVLDQLRSDGGTVSTQALERRVNLSRSRLDAMLKVLDVEGAVERVGGGWQATGTPWRYDTERLARVAAARQAEQESMRRYASTDQCLMLYLRRELDDPAAEPCGRCANCTGVPAQPEVTGDVDAAARFLRGQHTPLAPRRRWPAGLEGFRGNITPEERAEVGRVLSDGWGAGWDATLRPLLDGSLDDALLDELVAGIVPILAAWDWPVRPAWVCPMPSRRHGPLIATIAQRIADLGRMELHQPLELGGADRPLQAAMTNSTMQARNATAGVVVEGPVPPGPVLLIDDTVASGWTVTVAAALLRRAGAGPVLPLVLLRDR